MSLDSNISNIKEKITGKEGENTQDAEVLVEKAIIAHVAELKNDPEYKDMTDEDMKKHLNTVLDKSGIDSVGDKNQNNTILDDLNTLAASDMKERKESGEEFSGQLNDLLQEITLGLMNKPDASLRMRTGINTRAGAVESYLSQFDNTLASLQDGESLTICVKGFASWTGRNSTNKKLAQQRADFAKTKAEAYIKKKIKDKNISLEFDTEAVRISQEKKTTLGIQNHADPVDYQGIDIQIIKNIKRSDAIQENTSTVTETAGLTEVSAENINNIDELSNNQLLTITEKDEGGNNIAKLAAGIGEKTGASGTITSWKKEDDTYILQTEAQEIATDENIKHELHITKETNGTYKITVHTFTQGEDETFAHTKTQKINYTPATSDSGSDSETTEATRSDATEVQTSSGHSINESFAMDTLINDENNDHGSAHLFELYHTDLENNHERKDFKDDTSITPDWLNKDNGNLKIEEFNKMITEENDKIAQDQQRTLNAFDHTPLSNINHLRFRQTGDTGDNETAYEVVYDSSTQTTIIKKIDNIKQEVPEVTVISKTTDDEDG